MVSVAASVTATAMATAVGSVSPQRLKVSDDLALQDGNVLHGYALV